MSWGPRWYNLAAATHVRVAEWRGFLTVMVCFGDYEVFIEDVFYKPGEERRRVGLRRGCLHHSHRHHSIRKPTPALGPTKGSSMNTNITTEIVVVTPAIARQWLDGSTIPNFRVLEPHKMQRYARAMSEGQWRLNGETITFDANGNLLNGNHRLHAVIYSGCHIQMLIVRGVSAEPSTVLTMDEGPARTLGQYLAAHGEKNATTLSGVLTAMWQHKHTGRFDGQTADQVRRGTKADMVGVLNDHPDIRDVTSIAKRLGVRYGLPGGAVGALYYHLIHSDPVNAEMFFDLLSTGVVTDERDQPIALAIKTFLEDKGKLRRMTKQHLMALLIKAWNQWVTGEHRQRLTWTPGGHNAEAFPTPLVPSSTDLSVVA